MKRLVNSPLRPIIYFGYYLLKSDYKKLKGYISHLHHEEKYSYFKLYSEMLRSTVVYKNSFEDYFVLRLYEKNKQEWAKYVGTGFMYEFQHHFNNPEDTKYLRNKSLFCERFKQYIKRDFLALSKCTYEEFAEWIRHREQVIAKPSLGTTGLGIEKIRVNDFASPKELYEHLQKSKLDLLEDLITQHEAMNKLSPNSVNTVRVMTVLLDGQVHFLGAILRMGIGKVVDNWSAGGIAAPVDLETGVASGPAVGRHVRESTNFVTHPNTNVPILGFQIPLWNEIRQLVTKAALTIPTVGTVGWDVAVTPEGPVLIEGNENWDKLMFQCTAKEGKREQLEKLL